MHRIGSIVVAVALLFGVAACQTTAQAPSVSPIVNATYGVLPENVQQALVKACGFLPAAETASALLAAFGGPAVPGILNAIANEVCSTISKPKASGNRLGLMSASSPPVVRGVVLRGSRV